MGEIIIMVAGLAAFFILIGVVWLVAVKLGLLKPEPKKGGAAAADKSSDRYRIRDGVLSPGERAFLPVLREAVMIAWAARSATAAAAAPAVLASVRLAEVLTVDSSGADGRSARQSAFNKISSKQADFVLCDAATTRPLLIVELDDRSHDQPDRAKRDDFVDRACSSAGLPVLHVPAAAAYNAQALARSIAEKLGPGSR